MTGRHPGRPRRVVSPGAALCLLLVLPLLLCGWLAGHPGAGPASPQLVAVTKMATTASPPPQPTPTSRAIWPPTFPTIPAATPTATATATASSPATAPGSVAATPSASATATASPSAGPSDGTDVDTGPGQDKPGFFDVTGRVKAAIDGWMADLVTSALNPTLRLLGRTLLSTPDLTGDQRIQQLWTGSQIAANSVFVLFILAGGALVMTGESLNSEQTRYTLKEVAPRLLVAIVAANVSLQLIAPMIEFANAFTSAVIGNGLDPAATGQRLTQILVQAIVSGPMFLRVMGIVTAVLAVIVVLSYILRVTATILLIVSAPLFLMCHALAVTNPAARFWWRAFGGCLGIQLGQGITLLTAMRLFFTPSGSAIFGLPDSAGLINVLVATCMLWILARIPFWVSKAVFSGGRSSVVGIVRSVILLRGLRTVGILRR